jgi:CBS domain-containing protein
MPQKIRDVMTSNPCTIDANESVAYAAKMMREEDVGLAPIVEDDKLVGMLTDRDIAVRVAAQGRNPDQVKVRDVASKRLVTIDPQQDLDEALRMMAKHQVRRLPVVEGDGRLVGVVAQADIAREGDEEKTGRLVEEISEPGGQMSSFEEGQFERPFGEQPEVQQDAQPVVEQQEEPREEESISRVAAASTRGRKRKTAARKSTGTRKRKSTGGRKKSTGRKKKSTTSRKKSTGTRARSTARRKTTGRKRSTAKRKTAARKKTGTRKRKTAARKAAGTRKRKTAARKTAGRKAAATRKRKTTARRSTAKRSTAKRKTTARRSTGTRRKRRTARKS